MFSSPQWIGIELSNPTADCPDWGFLEFPLPHERQDDTLTSYPPILYPRLIQGWLETLKMLKNILICLVDGDGKRKGMNGVVGSHGPRATRCTNPALYTHRYRDNHYSGPTKRKLIIIKRPIVSLLFWCVDRVLSCYHSKFLSLFLVILKCYKAETMPFHRTTHYLPTQNLWTSVTLQTNLHKGERESL